MLAAGIIPEAKSSQSAEPKMTRGSPQTNMSFSSYVFILMCLLKNTTQTLDPRFHRYFCLGQGQVKSVSLFKVRLKKIIKQIAVRVDRARFVQMAYM